MAIGVVQLNDKEAREVALCPPLILQEMRVVSQGGQPGKGFEWLLDFKNKKPREFLRDLKSWDGEWRTQVKELLVAAPVEGEDVGADLCLALVERLLEQTYVADEEQRGEALSSGDHGDSSDGSAEP
jgi:hypothetical protein